jgi:hypothetical protein
MHIAGSMYTECHMLLFCGPLGGYRLYMNQVEMTDKFKIRQKQNHWCTIYREGVEDAGIYQANKATVLCHHIDG